MKTRKGIRYLVGGISLVAELLLTSCSASSIEDKEQREIISFSESEETIASNEIEEAIDSKTNEHDSINKRFDDFYNEYIDGLDEDTKFFYSIVLPNAERIFISPNDTNDDYEVIIEYEGFKYTLYHDVNYVNLALDLSNCQKLTISNDKANTSLPFLMSFHTIKELTIDDCNISSLEGIENLSNLETLIIKNCENLTDISSIKNLTNIKTIKINGTKISDISALSYLPNLSYINLRCNEITNPEVLESLENISKLQLEFNKIEDVEQLKGLIEKGILSDSQATDIVKSAKMQRLSYSLQNYKEEANVIIISYIDSKEAYFIQLLDENLELLYFALTPDICDLYNITDGLPNCKGIRLYNLPKEASSFDIANEENYEEMVIDNCDFDSLFFLDKYNNLTGLWIDKCPNIEDSSYLWYLDKLKVLSIIGTNIDSLCSIERISTLEYIELKYNSLSDFGFLTMLPNLKTALIVPCTYPVNEKAFKEMQNNGVDIYVWYLLPEQEQVPEEQKEQTQEQEKSLGLTPDN